MVNDRSSQISDQRANPLAQTDKSSPAALTDAQAARYIGMSISWLRQSRMRGGPDMPPYIKIGRSVRYRAFDLEQ